MNWSLPKTATTSGWSSTTIVTYKLFNIAQNKINKLMIIVIIILIIITIIIIIIVIIITIIIITIIRKTKLLL